MAAGRVEAIAIAEDDGAPQLQLESVDALAGRGLRGDRYCLAEPGPESDSNLTLIERAAYEHLESQGIPVKEPLLRRNLIVSGIELNSLVDREFTVGSVRCRGTELCHPCSYLESVTRPGVLKTLVLRGGIRAEILTDGTIHLGDEVAPSD